MSKCIFCQIISKEIDAYMIYENELVCCFLDNDPINKGHLLVVPKKHYQEFPEVDRESLIEVITVAQRAARALESILNTDGLTVMQNNGIFKDVEHYHILFRALKGMVSHGLNRKSVSMKMILLKYKQV
ncbi:HIT family protein [Peribacillus sp. FSL H8-0477]|uniref:HIT family protein n=1 Tax=Peribacillus sp. FSL H8-0477 TaxID=2921388 RepID=UPI0030F979E9